MIRDCNKTLEDLLVPYVLARYQSPTITYVGCITPSTNSQAIIPMATLAAISPHII